MKRVFTMASKFIAKLLRIDFPKRNELKLVQQIGKSEQLLSIAEIEVSGKKIIKMTKNRAFAEEVTSPGSANSQKVSKVKQKIKLNLLDLFVDENKFWV